MIVSGFFTSPKDHERTMSGDARPIRIASKSSTGFWYLKTPLDREPGEEVVDRDVRTRLERHEIDVDGHQSNTPKINSAATSRTRRMTMLNVDHPTLASFTSHSNGRFSSTLAQGLNPN